MTSSETPELTYEAKFALLNRNMRWEVADLLRERNLAHTNQALPTARPKHTLYTQYFKRGIDVALSGIALILTLPLNLIGAIVTYFDVGRPLIFKQQRLGQQGELFTLYKFRNMRNVYDENGHLLPGKDRVTKAGRFARKASLDELMNFWSVFKGDMSLIGPRPLVPEYDQRYSDRHWQRMAVKPGIECPPRSSKHSVATWEEQFENDVWYVENASFLTDVKLLFRLVSLALNTQHANRRSGALKGSFMGYDEHGGVLDSYSVPETILDTVLKRHSLPAEAANQTAKSHRNPDAP